MPSKSKKPSQTPQAAGCRAAASGSPILDLTNPITFNEWFLRQHPKRQGVLREDKWMLAEAAFRAGFESAQFLANVKDHSPIGAVSASNLKPNSAAPIG